MSPKNVYHIREYNRNNFFFNITFLDLDHMHKINQHFLTNQDWQEVNNTMVYRSDTKHWVFMTCFIYNFFWKPPSNNYYLLGQATRQVSV